MWTTFSKQQSTQKILVPGEYGATTTVTVPAATVEIPSTEIIPADAVNTVRFVNLSVENKPDTNGDAISIYVGIDFDPTPALHSFELLSGQQEYAMQINGQKINAIAESGQTIKINVQIAIAVVKTL